MDIGMLWFDNDKKTGLAAKVSRAATYYQNKYGKRPNLCFVNPASLNGTPAECRDIEIRSANTIRPNHLWLGYHDK